MSAGERLGAAIVAALEGNAMLAGTLTAVFDAPPVRGARPYAVVEDPVTGDWGTKDMAGRTARVAVLLFDIGERPARLRTLMGAVEEAVATIPSDLGGGWRLVTCRPFRSRTRREGDGRWTGMGEFAATMLRTN